MATGGGTDTGAGGHAPGKGTEKGFHQTLEVVDGAARIPAPIFEGLTTGGNGWGRFLKDYAPTDW